MDLRSSTEMFPIPETVSVPNISQLLATAAVEDLSFDQATRSSSSIRKGTGVSLSLPLVFV